MDTLDPADTPRANCREVIDQAAGPRLRAIADQLRRLAPSRTDPHAYFQKKSDLVDELRRLALGLDQVGPAPRSIALRSRTLASMSKPGTMPEITGSGDPHPPGRNS